MNLRGVRGVGHGVRHPDVPVHRRHVRHDRDRPDPVFILGDALVRSAQYAVTPGRGDLTGFALLLLCCGRSRVRLLGADRRRGDLQRGAGVPPPKSRNAATTLAADGRHRDHACSPADRAGPAVSWRTPSTPATSSARRLRVRPQRTVMAQLAAASFGGTRSASSSSQAATALVLLLAANTAFNGFPVLGSILAQDRYLPRQLHTRGDRLAFSNGILLLAGFAMRADRRVPGRGDPADPALHRRRLRLVHARPGGHGPALEPALRTERDPAEARRRMRRVRGRSTPSAAASPASCWSSC